mgnify:CR=1 FL=1
MQNATETYTTLSQTSSCDAIDVQLAKGYIHKRATRYPHNVKGRHASLRHVLSTNSVELVTYEGGQTTEHKRYSVVDVRSPDGGECNHEEQSNRLIFLLEDGNELRAELRGEGARYALQRWLRVGPNVRQITSDRCSNEEQRLSLIHI